ncbi:MAG: ABC transporter permease subunit [Bacteroidia bacterium]|jgi:ABC-2 type transport system permease protein|nr:ABC transporter permease subunit [Bacteroidota bacterium]MBP6512366.1 ABC transporter permease subunit [Bacteroidia bacterium]MBP7244963.1 ABC transporter permease subunit [Bacteroidia bacterium]
MWRNTQTELVKIFAKPRSYIGFIAIAIIVSLIHVAMYVDGLNYISFITGPLESAFNIEGKILNGNLVCFIILQTLIIQIPLLVALVTGDLISGEAAMGTIRLLMTRPLSRTSVLFSKFFAGAVYVFILLIWLALVSLGIGLLIFGPGDLIVLKSETITIIPADDTLWRFFAGLGIAFISLLVVASFSLLLSCFTDNSIGPIISTMAVIILFTIVGSMDIPLFEKIKPFLFTTHMVIWRNMFDQELDYSLIYNSIMMLFGHIILFLFIAWYSFRKKDILS